MSKNKRTLIQKFKKKNPKIYESIKLITSLSILGGVLMPTFMWADSNKLTNIHSARQIEAFESFEKLRESKPTVYKVLQKQYEVNTKYCINQLKDLDMHNSNYYECKKIANKLITNLESIN
jgi:hypothetical protein